MSNKKQRVKNRATYNALMGKLEAQGKIKQSICANCGKPGSHYVMACFGQEGYFHCIPDSPESYFVSPEAMKEVGETLSECIYSLVEAPK